MKYFGQAEATATKIIDAFKSGNIPAALAPIFIDRAGLHCSSYSWANRLLIALAGYTDVMGFGNKQGTSGWKSVGRSVRKGEKATYILAPCTRKIEDPKAEGGFRFAVYGFRTTPVFDITQTDVVDAEKWAKHNKGNQKSDQFVKDLPLRAVADHWGLSVSAYKGQAGKAHGWYRHGQAIAVGVENLSTWAHELIHAADDRNGKLVEKGQHYRSETVAELGGAILMMMMDFETDADLGGCFQYIEAYAKRAEIEVIKACNEVLKRTCEAVNAVLEAADTIGLKPTAAVATVSEPTTQGYVAA